ncbi:MAG: Fic family protein [Steroidobacteraceae bacterium]
MTWNWQESDWPDFRFQPERLAARETVFLRQSGVVVGTVKHLPDEERLPLVIDLFSTEALKTSEIEGELLDRDSVQLSLRRQFGLQTDNRRVAPAEQGIAQVLSDLYRHFAQPLDEQTLFQWHGWLMQGRTDLNNVGSYRTHAEPMQLVSGTIHQPKVHFEAPPSSQVPAEMKRFCHWFNDTAPVGKHPLPALTRAGIAHLYYECIHPFEDGNGRIGRAIAEKALAQGAGQPSLTALSLMIQKKRSEYYDQLEAANKKLEADEWLHWFADTVLVAQDYTLHWLDFLLAKTRLLDRLRGQINERQEKALLRMMREGPDGFRGGLSASNYTSITGAPAATARRDLAHLVELGALVRTGQLKGTRYWLPFKRQDDADE